MVKGLYVILYAAAQKPASKGHKKLKATEIRTLLNRHKLVKALYGNTVGYGNGKGIHSKTYGNKENRNKAHYSTSNIVFLFISILKVYAV